MSAKTVILKKVRKEIKSVKPKMINDLARELVMLPLKERIKLAARIVFKGKL